MACCTETGIFVYKVLSGTELVCGWPSGSVTRLILQEELPFFTQLKESASPETPIFLKSRCIIKAEWCSKSKAFIMTSPSAEFVWP